MNSPEKKRNSMSVTTKAIVGAVILAVLVALVVAIATSRDSSDDSSPTTSTDSVAPSAVEPGENQAVSIEGQRLDPLDDASSDVSVGGPAPTLNGYSFDGRPVSVTPGDGRPYMVVFLAHWCPHCNAEVPRLIEWKDSGGVPDDLVVVGVSTAVASDRPNYPPSQWVVDKGWPWPVMADSAAMDAAAAYGVSGFPFFTIIGPDGTVRLRTSGEKSIDEIDALVDQALAN